MASKFRTWWQKITQTWRIAVVAILLALIVVVVLGYWLNWHWTGLVPETSEPEQHAKTLWDWLGLLATLAIPVVVGFGAAWFTAQQGKVSERENKDNQREKALQDYIDKLSELLLEKNLRTSAEGHEVRMIARVRTLTVLGGLDAFRKARVLQFLYESRLVDKNKRIIDLSGADFSLANLSGGTNLGLANLSGGFRYRKADLRLADLSGADLSLADLSLANLSLANLSGANLRDANLIQADLSQANLRGADLSNANFSLADLKGTTMPDGRMYPYSSGASLHEANLKEVNLSGVDLSGADLSGADLRNADLSGVDLGNADLSGANLSKTNLKDADLSGANLTHAFGVTPEELEKQARSLKGATTFVGLKHP